MVVVFPAPLGPSRPKTVPPRHRQIDAFQRDDLTATPGKTTGCVHPDQPVTEDRHVMHRIDPPQLALDRVQVYHPQPLQPQLHKAEGPVSKGRIQ